MSPVNILSLSHSDDFDGIGSQAIIYRYFNELKKLIPTDFGEFPDADVRLSFFQTDYQDYLFYWAAIITGFKSKHSHESTDFMSEWISTYLKLHNVKDMDELANSFNKPSQVAQNRIYHSIEIWKNIDIVILSDIGYNKSFKSLFSMLKNLDIPIVYFDHHNHDNDTQEFFSKYCRIYRVDENRCATQIVHQYFLPTDTISKFIGDLGADTDFGKYTMRYSKEIMSFISHYRKTPHILNKIIENYAKGINFDAEMQLEFRSIHKNEIIEAQKMLDSIRDILINVNENKQIRVFLGISMLRSGRSMNHLETAQKKGLFTGKSNEIILLLTIDQQTLNTNIKSDQINVHRIAEHFGGGGHKNRAGFRFPSAYRKKNSLSIYNLDDLKLSEFLDELTKLL